MPSSAPISGASAAAFAGLSENRRGSLKSNVKSGGVCFAQFSTHTRFGNA
jgi:hypothetical protein